MIFLLLLLLSILLVIGTSSLVALSRSHKIQEDCIRMQHGDDCNVIVQLPFS